MYQRNLLKGQHAPQKPPSFSTAIMHIARLGGFLARKGDGDPGVKTIWRGWQNLQHRVAMLEAVQFSGLLGEA